MKKENEPFITEISEEDFRKLNLVGYKQVLIEEESAIPGKRLCHYEWKEVKMNDVLTENIEFLMDFGYDHNLEELKCPFTLAIHKENGPDPRNYYWDKFMNRFCGPQTYQEGIGIKHLYVTRDYFEDKKDYWRVFKRETKAIYRIHVDQKWIDKFVVRHKIVEKPWNEVYDGDESSKNWLVCFYYDLDEKTGEWKEGGRAKVIRGEHNCIHTPINKDGTEKERKFEVK